MRIEFENLMTDAYAKICDETQTLRESADSVIPDTKPDVAGIVSVQRSVYLKSKDVTGRGVTVTGEVRAEVLYICEGESTVCAHTIAQSFTAAFESAEIDLMAVPIITLHADNAQVRILNPRKLAVSFAITARLCCFARSPIMAKQLAGDYSGLHLRQERREQLYTSWAGEKTFAVNEQFPLPDGSRPSLLCAKRTDFTVTDRQCVGTKLLVKGSVGIELCWLGEGSEYPVCSRFSAPFSQLVETDTADICGCEVFIEPTSCYTEITESINGGFAFDCEIHAVMQAAAHSRGELTFFSDAYSNTADCVCERREISIVREKKRREELCPVQQTMELPEDCADVLCVLSSAGAASENAEQTLAIDVLYKTGDGRLTAIHRSLALGVNEGKFRMTRLQTEFAAKSLTLDVAGSVSTLREQTETAELLTAVELTETESVGQTPSLYAVRCENETLWELAKTYHSSVERIRAANGESEAVSGKILLVPVEN